MAAGVGQRLLYFASYRIAPSGILSRDRVCGRLRLVRGFQAWHEVATLEPHDDHVRRIVREDLPPVRLAAEHILDGSDSRIQVEVTAVIFTSAATTPRN